MRNGTCIVQFASVKEGNVQLKCAQFTHLPYDYLWTYSSMCFVSWGFCFQYLWFVENLNSQKHVLFNVKITHFSVNLAKTWNPVWLLILYRFNTIRKPHNTAYFPNVWVLVSAHQSWVSVNPHSQTRNLFLMQCIDMKHWQLFIITTLRAQKSNQKTLWTLCR